MGRKTKDPDNIELTAILEELLANDVDITARAVVRMHSSINNPSDFTRNASRSHALHLYQKKQEEVRKLSKRIGGSGSSFAARSIEALESRLKELEENEDARILSHIAMINAVCELGGTAQLRRFYTNYSAIRNSLVDQGALPSLLKEDIQLVEQSTASKRPPLTLAASKTPTKR